jgi:hypothetical protein
VTKEGWKAVGVSWTSDASKRSRQAAGDNFPADHFTVCSIEFVNTGIIIDSVKFDCDSGQPCKLL